MLGRGRRSLSEFVVSIVIIDAVVNNVTCIIYSGSKILLHQFTTRWSQCNINCDDVFRQLKILYLIPKLS